MDRNIILLPYDSSVIMKIDDHTVTYLAAYNIYSIHGLHTAFQHL